MTMVYFEVLPDIFLEGLRKAMKSSVWPGQTLPEC